MTNPKLREMLEAKLIAELTIQSPADGEGGLCVAYNEFEFDGPIDMRALADAALAVFTQYLQGAVEDAYNKGFRDAKAAHSGGGKW